MATVIVLLGVLVGIWFWRSNRWSAIWGAMTGSNQIASS